MLEPVETFNFVSTYVLRAEYLVIVILLSLFFAVIRKQSRDALEILNNLGIFLIAIALTYAGAGVLWFKVLDFFHSYKLMNMEFNYFTIFISFVLTDLTFYLAHRLQHKVDALWVFHQVHHSSVNYCFSTGVRLPWFGFFYIWIFYVPLVLIGFSPILILFNRTAILIYQFFIHRPVFKKDTLVGKLFCTPQTHLVHHISSPQFYNKNFGGVFSVWDRVFGTYHNADGIQDATFGIVDQPKVRDPFAINFQPVILYAKKFSKRVK
jgi:sterol desaturase/sphingolipid hydroxylase (fatty acid hydroxylase superfamily)